MSRAERIWRIIGGRKFVGLILATFLCYIGRLDGSLWVIAFGVYCGANVSQKIFRGDDINEVVALWENF